MPIDLNETRQHVLDVAMDVMARRGYSAVGVNEVLAAAGVPKGSFYYHFGSKEAFGQAMLEGYFRGYLANMDMIASDASSTGAERLMLFWQQFHEKQAIDECQGRCLVVKLAAEVSDLSEPLRLTLLVGTDHIIERVELMLRSGIDDGSLRVEGDPKTVAASLYGSWVGASILAKISHSPELLDTAMSTTRSLLHL